MKSEVTRPRLLSSLSTLNSSLCLSKPQAVIGCMQPNLRACLPSCRDVSIPQAVIGCMQRNPQFFRQRRLLTVSIPQAVNVISLPLEGKVARKARRMRCNAATFNIWHYTFTTSPTAYGGPPSPQGEGYSGNRVHATSLPEYAAIAANSFNTASGKPVH